ncbi:MAG: carboxypeptidase M32, partial [Solirubrobacteraceae bacterium]
MTAMERLNARLAELSDLRALQNLASWDQLVMMPPAGAEARGHQLATLSRLAHEHATVAELGEALAELEDVADGLDADIVRLARRDWERARRVPSDLAAELSKAHAVGQERWRA